jgi:hypothetical protein
LSVPLQHADLLTLIAEVSAAFVGFSLVIGLLQPDQPSSAAVRNAMRGVAELALIAGGGALLALSLHAFELAPESIWRFGSLALATTWLAAHLLAARRFRAARSPMLRSNLTLLPVPIAFAGILLLYWNFAVPSSFSGARYAAALVFALSASAVFFIGATFRHPDK